MQLLNRVRRRAEREIRNFANRHERRRHAEAALVGPDKFPRGSAEWLVAAEAKYGGLQTNVPRVKVSPSDPRSESELAHGGMTGGDRMSILNHGYGPTYADFIAPFLSRDPQSITLIEIGVLKGSGLALWADLFPGATIIGLDIDLSHFRANLSYLRAQGAFKVGAPILHEFDQFRDGKELIGEVLAGRKADIVIDDGFHSEEAIVNTFRAIEPFLAWPFVYFTEDDDDAAEYLSRSFPKYRTRQFNMMAVTTRS